ncbi:ABC transporter substrate-binding protein [Pelagibacterium sp.]|uniref:ABC transporter substrate-binding protein n=1 Tax=Pelagibacterium sp. TaxID=1967288 RepID=UPI003A90627C
MKLTQIRLLMGTMFTSGLLVTAPAMGQDVIRFATWDSDNNLAIQQEIAQLFEAQNPGVTVQVEPYADGYDQKLVAAFGAGSPPDVMYMWNFPEYHQFLTPLDDLIARDSDELNMEDIPAGLMNTAQIQGVTYGMPSGFTTQVVFYNKDMFAQAGVEEPQPGWTWEDLAAKAAQFRDEDAKVYGFAVEARPDPYDFEQFLWSNGTRYISEDGSEIDGFMNSPEAVEVLEMFAGLVRDEDAVLLGSGDMNSSGDLFRSGNIAMQVSAMWDKGGHDDAGINYGVIGLPSFGDKPPHSALGASAISIASDAAHPDLAWEFVKFFSSPEAVALRTGDLPIRTSVADDLSLTDDPIYRPFFEMLEMSDRETHAFLKHAEWSRIQDNLARAIEAIMLEQGNAQQHLDEAVSRSQRFM